MAVRLGGKVALVTGGGQGIGRAISDAYAREGAFVGIFDLKPEIAETAAAELVAAGGTAVGVVGNVVKREDVCAAVEKLRDVAGPVTVLVSNAMCDRYGPFEEQNE